MQQPYIVYFYTIPNILLYKYILVGFDFIYWVQVCVLTEISLSKLSLGQGKNPTQGRPIFHGSALGKLLKQPRSVKSTLHKAGMMVVTSGNL